MTSMNRFNDCTSSGEGWIVERGFAPDPHGLAALRLHLDADYARSLSTLIEGEIIPRLMVAHGAQTPPPGPGGSGTVIGADEIEAFAPLVMQIEADALLAHVEAILARGISFETVLVELLAPTARRLGSFWEEELCEFVDVTMGLWRLQEIVQELSGRLPTQPAPAEPALRALFVTMPGDKADMGTATVDAMFRREGWLTDHLGQAETHDLLNRVSNDWFDIIGLTVSSDCDIARLPPIIAALRNNSKNPQVCVMVGGKPFSADPELAAYVGADGVARDARFAPDVAGKLVRERTATPRS